MRYAEWELGGMLVHEDDIVLAVVLGVVMVFSVVSNLCVMIVVCVHPHMHTVTHLLITNLALSDLCLTAFVLPQNIHDLFHTKNYYEGKLLKCTVNMV